MTIAYRNGLAQEFSGNTNTAKICAGGGQIGGFAWHNINDVSYCFSQVGFSVDIM